ncbi:UNVERIFIED_CONTAM: uncharacterized 2Fe-2S/4Fe-4S cluster protein (DUF4445 family) [Acetivibrio alkalicellulosi]
MQYKIVFQPMGIVTSIEENETILHTAQRVGIGITAYCGGQKVCGKCKVKIIEGVYDSYGINSSIKNVYPIEDIEMKTFSNYEISHNYRLACIAKVRGNVVVEIPKESRLSEEVILKEGKERDILLKPAVKTYKLELEKALLKNNMDDLTRIKEALTTNYSEINKDLEIDFQLLKQLSQVLRESNWKINVTILYNKRIINVESEDCKRKYGVAIDVGTTTIAAYLCDLKTGKMTQSATMMNPQICFGDDVLTRISYCVNVKNGVEELQKMLIDGLNELLNQLVEKENISLNQICEVVMVCNTVMGHIALGINPQYLGLAPFISTVSEPIDVTARDIGINILPSGNIHFLPSEAGFIGADNVGVLISEEPYLQEKVKLIIDIGTNSEICLGNNEKLYTTSCATGPALEGAQIKCGMRAANGAIEAVEINPVTLEPSLKIIGEKKLQSPVGICGSGIIDVVSQMASTGIIESDGKFSKLIKSKRIRYGDDGKKEYVLYFKKDDNERDIVVTQKDVRAVQLAKGALYAGAKILMKQWGISNIDEIILAGAFGSYIDKRNALKLGMFPDCSLDNVKVVGNAAGTGARLALLNTDKRSETKNIAKKIEFVEIATKIDYQKMFAKSMAIPHESDSFPINQSYIFKCGGKDDRSICEEAVALGMDIIKDVNTMEKAILLNQKAEKTDYLIFPIINNIESIAYGALPKLLGNNYVFKDYIYQSIDNIYSKLEIIKNPVIQNTLECIQRQSQKKIVLNVQGPFSILATLVNPAKLYKYRGESKEFLLDVLNNIASSLGEYTVEAVKRGVDIISFADPEGVMEIVGEGFYKELSGRAAYTYLKIVEPYLSKTLVHICGKTSYSLQRGGFIINKVYRTDEKEYIKILFEYAKNSKFKYTGHRCIHNKMLSIPIVNRLELCNISESKVL